MSTLSTRALIPVGASLAVLGVFMGAWAVSTPEIERALGGGPGRLGAVLSVALVVAAGANTVGGAVAERLGTTSALRLTLTAWAVALCCGSVLPAPWGVALGVVVVLSTGGAVDVVANVAATAGLADRPGRLVRLHSIFNLGGAAGTVLVGVVLAVVGALGWRVAWVVTAGLVAVIVVCTGGVDLPAGQVGRKVPLSDGVRTLHREGLIPIAVAFALAAVVEGGIATWGVLQLRGQLDASLLVGRRRGLPRLSRRRRLAIVGVADRDRRSGTSGGRGRRGRCGRRTHRVGGARPGGARGSWAGPRRRRRLGVLAAAAVGGGTGQGAARCGGRGGDDAGLSRFGRRTGRRRRCRRELRGRRRSGAARGVRGGRPGARRDRRPETIWTCETLRNEVIVPMGGGEHHPAHDTRGPRAPVSWT